MSRALWTYVYSRCILHIANGKAAHQSNYLFPGTFKHVFFAVPLGFLSVYRITDPRKERSGLGLYVP